MNSPIPRLKKGLLDPERRRKGIYVLPNLFTSASLFAGFYAIVQGMDGKFEVACIAIFVAMVLDGLDGRVARMTRTTSEFGAQLDSLSDMVSFGAAPALVMYAWALQPLGKWGWIGAFIYCVCAALRLARFNTNLGVVDKRFFQGLPSPAAACLMAGLIWVLNEWQVSGGDVRWVAWVMAVFAGVTMISTVPYYSGKDFNLRRSVPFWVIPAIVVGYLLISIQPSHVLFGLFLCYALSGYLVWIMRAIRSPKNPANPGKPPAAPK
ncbi:MAG: CDP-diacylglycerol--serine O-phosphatidyltransferase [Rhodocyclaceae bacterium]|jgi:CDP-diacylglycerol--serine O-phosphatidyltransferase|nr:CDP-diacylglycerol--serine O-phosphatidyltransferase [Rhodocyclaceae bacterium]MCE2723974.1 CDP-diacylglycerol--serine O-phosphatidyltransferase [Betaproteobacteria bacterium]MCA3019606.1 CDP-diacylglycerol--serine O-phosphatidyltransferase [Rhodocyclaceae bacterium]MCA3021162.1 CDP-diacylglycerol--serine O-phosphatidyltransferase [Rhodocyclaceae bacterium]MCA3026351.1 CDP-diacylglycerol--serine O-phosphatidyltransferase [Rhodocyclaceae bacterium]